MIEISAERSAKEKRNSEGKHKENPDQDDE